MINSDKRTKHCMTQIPLVFIILIVSTGFPFVASGSGVISAAPGLSIGDDIALVSDDSDTGVMVTIAISDSKWILDTANDVNLLHGIMDVKSLTKWRIRVSADTTTKGFASEYDTVASQFVNDGKALKNALRIRAEGGNNIDLVNGGVILEGEGNKSTPIFFEQTLDESDAHLPQGHYYNIMVSFVGSKVQEA